MDQAAIATIRRTLRALRSERRRGFDDSAAPDGMERMIRHAVGLLASAELPDRARESLRRLERDMRGYQDLPPQRRGPLVERALSLLEAIAPEQAQAQPERAEREEPAQPLSWEDPVRELSGVGPARAEALERLGVRTIGDLLLHCPARYEDRRQVLTLRELTHGQTAAVRVTVTRRGRRSSRRRSAAAIVPVESGGTEGELLFFRQPWRVERHDPGEELLVVGTARIDSGDIAIAVAECESLDAEGPDAAGCIVPVYPSTEGVSQRMHRRWVGQALERCPPPEDPLPERLLGDRGLMPLAEALRQVHQPTDFPRQRAARHRLAYQELFALQLSLALRRAKATAPDPGASIPAAGLPEALLETLPFEPTAAQERVIAEVLADLSAGEPAHRLVHGEVGSGKTVVAAVALAAAVRAGRQAAMMAPTEVLAEQHHESLAELLGPMGLQPVLLTGSTPAAERAAAEDALAAGEAICAVGTHALFSAGVEFADLAVAVIDEQHRFGVRQRARLSAKGARPNVLVMSATPIPRTLALAVYGDFDVSVIDELPPGRRRPETRLLSVAQADEAWAFVRERVAEGRQAYVVCPAIDASEEMTAAAETFEELAAGPLRELRLGLVHGRLEADQRHRVMGRFREGEIDVLVATSLIEVGLNVPNATTIVILDAERFGLAQLHQLRGRVARAAWQPHCILLSGTDSPEALDRLAVLVRTTDGFEIAEEDLRRRGPGELDGIRQSGLPDLRITSIIADTAALWQAREDAFSIIERDPELALPEHAGLSSLLAHSRHGELWTL
ncbi:MAG: ATP-dependent DNA helicase RecG [Armatimonadota bacterium]|nr:ATP-dependent DNA helicase RecG [Armatimonadota bacterium]